MKKRFLFCWLLLICAGWASAQNPKPRVARIVPDQPRWGTTLTVIYDTKAEGAKFAASDEVYVVGSAAFTDHSSKRIKARMTRESDLLKYEMPVAENLSYVSVYFVTFNDLDTQGQVITNASTMIYRPDGMAARTAHQYRLMRNYEEVFNKEISLYPDNYAAYRTRWFLADAFDKEKVEAIVRADIEKLQREVKSETVELLYALSYGYLLLKQEPESRKVIRRMVAEHPRSPLTDSAFSNYDYQIFSQRIRGEGPEEIKKLAEDLIRQNPDLGFARSRASMLAGQKDFPFETVETICRKWIKDEPDNPQPYLALASACKTHKQKLDQASSFIDRGINLLLEGRMRLYDDIAGTMSERMIPRAYQQRAEIALEREDYATAIASIKAAQSLASETDRGLFLTEGEVWRRANNTARAEAAYLEAARLGSKEAESALKEIYLARRGSAEGFEEYISKAKSVLTTSGGKAAEPFQVTSLDGRKFDLTALRGKVVVLNFWFIGCAPCRVEIPSLNKLVAEFKDKEVVFIGLANDPPDSLRKFLKTNPFDYHIVANSYSIADRYGVSAYPVHLIIDREGRVSARLTGGSETRHDDIRPLIERALSR